MKCNICGNEIIGVGNDPTPIGTTKDHCCDRCNYVIVSAFRVALDDKIREIMDRRGCCWYSASNEIYFKHQFEMDTIAHQILSLLKNIEND